MQSAEGAGEQCAFEEGAVSSCQPGEDECPANTAAPTSANSNIQLTNEPTIQITSDDFWEDLYDDLVSDVSEIDEESGASGFPLFMSWVILALYTM